MNLSLRTLLPAILAILILVVIGLQTSDALKRSGSWSRSTGPKTPVIDPYAALDGQLARQGQPPEAGTLRDPFAFGGGGAVAIRREPRTGRPSEAVQPPPRPRPVLTAIIADEDPRALIVYEDRNYSVKTGDLFAEFRVVSVNAEQVVLDGGGQRLVLRRPVRGD